MTQIDELVKRARDHVTSRGGQARDENGEIVVKNGAGQMLLDLCDALETQAADLTRLRERNAELEKHLENAECDFVSVCESSAKDVVYAKARITTLEATVKGMMGVLEDVVLRAIQYGRKAALDAAAAVDGNPVDIRTVTAYECGFEEGKREAAVDGNAQWNAIDACERLLDHIDNITYRDLAQHRLGDTNPFYERARAAIRSLKRA